MKLSIIQDAVTTFINFDFFSRELFFFALVFISQTSIMMIKKKSKFRPVKYYLYSFQSYSINYQYLNQYIQIIGKM